MRLQRIKTIGEYHQQMGHPQPLHPLFSLIHLESVQQLPFAEPTRLVYDFYCITLKKTVGIHYRYGQQSYDFTDGTMFFMAPDQVFSFQRGAGPVEKPEGWALLIHPDFLWGTALAKTIQRLDYFDYAAHEALHLSQAEERIIGSIIHLIELEYHMAIDRFSKSILVSHLESLLTYADRFYQRQFVTREMANHQLVDQLDRLLTSYFTEQHQLQNGVPSVQYVSDALNLSPNYLSRVLTTLTGKSTKKYISDKVIQRAKETLSTTNQSVSEVAYGLGFDYPQTFSKFFKTHTGLAPLAFRASFS